MRAAELLALNFENADPITGTLQVMHGKGDKFRAVYLGKKSRIALRSYYRKNKHHEGALIIGVHGERLTYTGLHLLLIKKGEKSRSGIPIPAFIQMLICSHNAEKWNRCVLSSTADGSGRFTNA